MAEKNNIPSNEDIIEDLTKDLNKTNLNQNNSTLTSASSSSEVKNKNFKDEGPIIDELIDDGDEGEIESSQDDIDEVALKDIELTLSDEEKEKRRNDAEEYKNNGNELFKSGKYLESIEKYTNGLRICPLAYPNERAILYSNRAAAKMKLDLKKSALEDCSKSVELNPNYIRALHRRAQIFEQLEKLDESLSDYQKILELDPKHKEANYEIRRLPSLIEERNEKLKAEMLGKLKDLGDIVLRPFGLSTNNFQLNKDPNTGGYSINFQQNQ